METTFKTNPETLLKLYTTKKDFFLYDQVDGVIKNSILTNDLTRYRNKFQKWHLVELIKPKIKTLQITL